MALDGAIARSRSPGAPAALVRPSTARRSRVDTADGAGDPGGRQHDRGSRAPSRPPEACGTPLPEPTHSSPRGTHSRKTDRPLRSDLPCAADRGAAPSCGAGGWTGDVEGRRTWLVGHRDADRCGRSRVLGKSRPRAQTDRARRSGLLSSRSRSRWNGARPERLDHGADEGVAAQASKPPGRLGRAVDRASPPLSASRCPH